MLANEISNLKLHFEDSRKHRFNRTSEQRWLLNSRNIDKSSMDKSEYDGSDKKDIDNNGNETGSDTSSNSSQSVQNNKSSRKKEIAPRVEKT